MKLGVTGSGLIVQEFLPSLVQVKGLRVQGLQCTPKSEEKARALCEANHITSVVSGGHGNYPQC